MSQLISSVTHTRHWSWCEEGLSLPLFLPLMQNKLALQRPHSAPPHCSLCIQNGFNKGLWLCLSRVICSCPLDFSWKSVQSVGGGVLFSRIASFVPFIDTTHWGILEEDWSTIHGKNFQHTYDLTSIMHARHLYALHECGHGDCGGTANAARGNVLKQKNLWRHLLLLKKDTVKKRAS